MDDFFRLDMQIVLFENTIRTVRHLYTENYYLDYGII